MTSPMGERPAMLSITESSGNLEGSLTTRMGTATVSGYADGNSIKFSAQVQGPMAAMTLEFSGTVDGDEASGVMQSGSTGSGRWSGSRTTGEEGIHAVAAASHATQDGPSSVVGGPPGSTMHGGVGHTSGMPGAAGRAPGPGLEILRSPAALKRTFSSLGEPSYRNLWIGFLLSMGGMQMQMLARGFFIYHLTGSPALLGVVTAATAVPVLALALFGGVLADRGDKKRIIQAGQVVSLILVLVIAVSITTGDYYVAAFASCLPRTGRRYALDHAGPSGNHPPVGRKRSADERRRPQLDGDGPHNHDSPGYCRWAHRSGWNRSGLLCYGGYVRGGAILHRVAAKAGNAIKGCFSICPRGY